MRARAAEVSRALVSVSDMVDAGHTVTFNQERSYARHEATGVEIEFERTAGVWTLEMDVEPFEEAQKILRAAGEQPYRVEEISHPVGRRGFP